MKQKWVLDEKLVGVGWNCGGAALMLQTYIKEGPHAWSPAGRLGEGVSLSSQCEDAVTLYREFISRGLEASEPQVRNSVWVTFLSDTDGYRLEFESPTDKREETKLSDLDC